MKYCTIILTLPILLILWTPVSAQVVLKGEVRDEMNLTIPGAAVTILGSNQQTVTNDKGYFEFRITGVTDTSRNVKISFVGYQVSFYRLKPTILNRLQLKNASIDLQETVIIGYGTQKKATITGAISQVSGSELLKSPVGNASGALVGRLSGIQTRQTSGAPGNDNTEIRIRGTGTFAGSTSPLILVDGVERLFQQLDMQEIESVTVLKDASTTAIYGIRGANGVILVTTKRGKEGAAKVSYTSNFALQAPTRLPKPLNSFDFASLYNEATVNDNPYAILKYGTDDLQKYKDGSDPLFHPDVDWFNYVFQKVSPQQQHNINVSGGNKFARYFISLGYLNQKGLEKEFNQNYGFSNKDNYKRFNFRSNLDMNITPSTKVSFTLSGRSGEKNRNPDGSLYYTILGTPPMTSPGLIDGKIIVLEGQRQQNPVQTLTSGFNTYSENHLDIAIDGTQSLDVLTKGLSLKAKMSYDNDYRQQISRIKYEPMYTLLRNTVNGVDQLAFKQNGELASLGSPSQSFDLPGEQLYAEAALNYQRSFGKNNVSAIVVGNTSKRWFPGGGYPGVPVSYEGIVARLDYNYMGKYLAEVSMGYNGSENFPPNKRFGYFPAVSAGYVVSEEKFFKKYIPKSILSYLKLRASYGTVGNDQLNANRFLYFPSEYVSGSSYVFGDSPITYYGYKEGKIGNPNVTWEKAAKRNFGLDTRFLNDKLSISADYFYDTRDNILTGLQTVPASTGIENLGAYNIGATQNRGFELDMGWEHSIGKFNYWVKANYSFARNKIIAMNEAMDLNNPQLNRTGRRIGESFGYGFNGFFNNQSDVSSWPSQAGVTLVPGDVRYLDVNGDGVINTKDQSPIANPSFPEISYAFSSGFEYEKIDFSFLFQGSGNVSTTVADQFQKPFTALGSAFSNAIDRWTPTTTETATFPRLTTSYANANNYLPSTLWVQDASFLRLRNMEFGYSFSLKKIGVSKMRIYVNGQNLLTFDKLKIVDPEASASNSLYYPQVVTYNLGLNVNF